MKLINIDQLSLTMIALSSFIGIINIVFAAKYLREDPNRKAYFIKLVFLFVFIVSLFCANNLLLFWVSWGGSNLSLVALMVHNRRWPQARNAGKLALRNFALGWVSLGAAFMLIYFKTGFGWIEPLKDTHFNSALIPLLLLTTAMTQSAIWPFHKWLLSSLNSPTPVSALMHAGLINGGGYLLIRFAPIFSNSSSFLQLIFIIGLVTAVMGNLFKLIQPDIKKMLACSTMSQMGFMIAQCGLGLFSAAAAHLCWHGIFKAYLFFSCSGTARLHRFPTVTPTASQWLAALGCGIMSMATFIVITAGYHPHINASIFIWGIVAIMGTQLAIPLLVQFGNQMIVPLLLFNAFLGALYAANVMLIKHYLSPVLPPAAEPLHLIHLMALIILITCWAALFYLPKFNKTRWQKCYVKLLNASQPCVTTITAHRADYQGQ